MNRGSDRPPGRRQHRPSGPRNRPAGRSAADVGQARSGWAAPAEVAAQVWRSGPLSLPLAGIAAGLWAAAVGLVCTVLPTLIVWIFAAGDSSSETALRAGVDVWLVLQGVPLVTSEGTWSLLPVGLAVLPICFLWLSGRWVARHSSVTDPRSVGLAAASVAGGYGLAGLLGAIFATLPGVGPSPEWAFLRLAVLAFVVSGVSLAWTARLFREPLAHLWRILIPGAGAVMTVIGGSMLLLAGGLVIAMPALGEQWRGLEAGFMGALAIFVVLLGYLPAAGLWVLSYALGVGVSAGQWLFPWSTAAAPPPELPGLAQLPVTPQPWWLAAWLVPLGAGVVLVRLSQKLGASRFDVATGILAGLVLLLGVMGIWWMVATGAIGGGRLERLGPSPLVILAVPGGAALGALLDLGSQWALRWWRRRREVHGDTPAAGSTETSEPAEQVIDLTEQPDGAVDSSDAP